MAGAVLMAAFWQQIAFYGHDIGHNAVTHKRKGDLFWGILIGNTTGGISLGWWKRSHNTHHIVCNSIENDPDIQHLPFFAVVPDMLQRFWSSYHEKYFDTDAFARFLVSHQHILYYPIMAFARYFLYVQSYLLLLTRPRKETHFWGLELGTLLTFAGWFSSMIYFCCDSWQERLAYLCLSHGVAGILHVQITLSHFAEDTYHGQAYNSDEDEWFTMQLNTSLNVDCPTWMDWFHGGLQFQVEHHLYPRLPRAALREARKLVKPLAEKYGVQYRELPFFPCLGRVYRQLRATAMEARKATSGKAGLHKSGLYESTFAMG
jgi:delta8-fatty-acid desaturase